MGDLGYFVKCYDCGKEFMCGEHFFSYPPIERVCYHCALKRLDQIQKRECLSGKTDRRK
jgi:hypothetical protein